jgi:hypothetical protein
LLHNYTSSGVSINILYFIEIMLKHLTHNINPLIKLSFNTLKSTRGLDALSAVTGWCARPRRTGGMGRPADSVAGLGRQAEVVG